MRSAALALASLALLLAPASAAGSAPTVVTLTSDNWDLVRQAPQNGQGWLVEFYAPWCSHCKALAPKWEEASKELSTAELHFAKIDATSETALAREHTVKGFPNIKYFDKQGKMWTYKGPRDVDGIRAFVQKMTGPPLVTVTEAGLGEFKHKDAVVYLRVAAPGAADDAAYVELAKKFQDAIHFGKSEDKGLAKLANDACGGTALPLILMLNAEASEKKFSVDCHADGDAGSLADWVDARRFPPMVELGRKNFYKTCNTGKMAVLAVGDPSSKGWKKYREMSERVARSRLGQVRSGWLNGVEMKKFAEETFLLTQEDVAESTALVYDAKAKVFFFNHSITRTQAGLEQFIDNVLQGKVQGVATERGMLNFLKKQVEKLSDYLDEHPAAFYALVGCMLLAPGVMMFMPSPDGDDEKKEA